MRQLTLRKSGTWLLIKLAVLLIGLLIRVLLKYSVWLSVWREFNFFLRRLDQVEWRQHFELEIIQVEKYMLAQGGEGCK